MTLLNTGNVYFNQLFNPTWKQKKTLQLMLNTM